MDFTAAMQFGMKCDRFRGFEYLNNFRRVSSRAMSVAARCLFRKPRWDADVFPGRGDGLAISTVAGPPVSPERTRTRSACDRQTRRVAWARHIPQRARPRCRGRSALPQIRPGACGSRPASQAKKGSTIEPSQARHAAPPETRIGAAVGPFFDHRGSPGRKNWGREYGLGINLSDQASRLSACFASETMVSNPCGSQTAISARDFRSSSIPACLSPFISWL